ncbi:MAG: hypothetical protein GY927_00030 [bacterium]|nr:hypothetical protein [bacterium]
MPTRTITVRTTSKDSLFAVSKRILKTRWNKPLSRARCFAPGQRHQQQKKRSSTFLRNFHSPALTESAAARNCSRRLLKKRCSPPRRPVCKPLTTVSNVWKRRAGILMIFTHYRNLRSDCYG